LFEDREDFERWCEVRGYIAADDSLTGFEVYCAPAGAKDAFLCTIGEVENGATYVLVRNNADLFALQLAVAPMLQHEYVSWDFRRTVTLLDRLFRALHGHDSSVPCAKCDPDEVQRYARLRARRAQKPS
jgi:hypothetical protein